MSDFKYLFSPLKLGSITIPNRIHFAAHMTNFGEDYKVSDRHIHYYVERAKGGCGLITTEELSVHPSDHPYEKLVDAFAILLRSVVVKDDFRQKLHPDPLA